MYQESSSPISCRCGCVPSNLMSLFQMSELRKKKKSADKKFKKHMSILIDEQLSSSEESSSKSLLDLHSQDLSSCHLFFDNFMNLGNSLTALHLDNNLLNFIPNGILKSLPLLQDLALHNNQLEVLPAEIGMLSCLETLRLDGNNLTTLPPEMKKCTALVWLHISTNLNFLYFPDDFFENMTHLHHILADACPLLESFPQSLKECLSLEFVSIDSTVVNPPADVLAAGHGAIHQFFRPKAQSFPVEATACPRILHTEGHATHRNNALKYLELKQDARMNGVDRCERCWHMSNLCICSMLPHVALSDHIELVVYMDAKEVFNAGDDAKLLSIACPDQTKRFIYAAEDIELVDYITSLRVSNSSNQAVVLFPSSRAVSSDDFMTTWNEQTDPVYSQTNDEFHTSTLPGLKCSEENRNDAKINIPVKPRKLAIIVVDAVWRHARRMAQRLHLLLPDVPHVQLSPEQFSVYARKQSQPDRICTVEATALFLSHIGGASNGACEQLVDCVRINNTAVRPSPPPTTSDALSHPLEARQRVLDVREVRKATTRNRKNTCQNNNNILYTKHISATHPCWYYGVEFYHGEKKAKQAKTSKHKRRYL